MIYQKIDNDTINKFLFKYFFSDESKLEEITLNLEPWNLYHKVII